jgi:hypothetical protein
MENIVAPPAAAADELKADLLAPAHLHPLTRNAGEHLDEKPADVDDPTGALVLSVAAVRASVVQAQSGGQP